MGNHQFWRLDVRYWHYQSFRSKDDPSFVRLGEGKNDGKLRSIEEIEYRIGKCDVKILQERQLRRKHREIKKIMFYGNGIMIVNIGKKEGLLIFKKGINDVVWFLKVETKKKTFSKKEIPTYNISLLFFQRNELATWYIFSKVEKPTALKKDGGGV